MLDGNENQASNMEKDNKEKDKKNIYIFITDSYSHLIAITHIRQREQNAIDCLKFSVLFHLYHF